MKPTRPEGATGYKCKANRDGTYREGWEARHDLVKRGYRPSWVRLYYPETPEGRRQLAAKCQDLQGQMLAWAANDGAFPERGYDGTVVGPRAAILFQRVFALPRAQMEQPSASRQVRQDYRRNGRRSPNL